MEHTFEDESFLPMCSTPVVEANIFYLLESPDGLQCLEGIERLEHLKGLEVLERLKGLKDLERLEGIEGL